MNPVVSLNRIGGAFAAFVAWIALAACNTPDTCDGRGNATSYSGFATYGVATGAAATTESATIQVFDYQQACTYENEEFLVSANGCELWLTLTQAPERHVTMNTTAAVESGQMCKLSIAGGTVAFTAMSGSLTFASGMVDLSIAGTTSEAGTLDAGVAASPIAFQWSFQASGAAP